MMNATDQRAPAHRMMRTSAAAVAALAVLAGCSGGDGEDDDDEVESAVRGFYDLVEELASGDADLDMLEEVAGGQALVAEQEYVQTIRGDGWTMQSPPEVLWIETEVEGDQASAEVCLDATAATYVDADGQPVELDIPQANPLVMVDLERDDDARDGWLVLSADTAPSAQSCGADR